MEQQSASLKMQQPKSALKTILVAGLLAGVLDGLAAVLVSYIARDVAPQRVFRFIASGVFGKDAFQGGEWMALWGLIFHMVIAMGWAVLFFFLYPFLQRVLKNKIVIATVYGLFVWLMMNRVVLPLSNIPKGPFNLTMALVNMLILMICIGLPLTFITQRFYRRHH